jgi:hypothetical protein
MPKLLLDYTVLDEDYENGLFRFFQGTDGKPENVDVPRDTGLTGIIGPTDGDPVVHSYMGGENLDTPRALVSVIVTDLSTGGSGTSTGKYWVCTPTTPTAQGVDVSWAATGGPQGVEFVNELGDPLIGNLYGIAQVGGYLYMVDYDTTNIYRIDIAAFESSSGTTYTIEDGDITPASGAFPSPLPGNPQGAALIALTDNSGTTPATYLYAAYNFLTPASPEKPTTYAPGVIVRYTVDPGTGVIDETSGTYVTTGLNLQGLVPALGGPDGISILVPCIGGIQRSDDKTNGAASTLHRVPAFSGFIQANSIAALTGDSSSAAPALTVPGSYDVKSVAVSEDGLAYLLCETEDSEFDTWWKLYKTTAAAILGSTGTTILDAVSSHTLKQVDAGVGSKGYEWNLMYENADPGSNGRLWFVRGTPIQVSRGKKYRIKELFDTGILYPAAEDPEDPLAALTFKNVNSADLIGEMIYQFGKGHSIDTRLIKGKSASAKAAIAAAAAEEEDDEK